MLHIIIFTLYVYSVPERVHNSEKVTAVTKAISSYFKIKARLRHVNGLYREYGKSNQVVFCS